MSRTNRILTAITAKLAPLRKLIDGPESQDPAEQIAQFSVASSRSQDFMLKVAREIDRVLKEEFVSNRLKGTAYVPERFTVFISSSDDKAWTGQKRSFLAETLGDIILGEADKMCGNSLTLTVRSIEVDIRVDGTLADAELYVRPVADTSTDATLLNVAGKTANVDKTIFDPSGGVAGAKPLYFIELTGPGSVKQMLPVYKRLVTIGRGSRRDQVDIRLEGEPRISRLHASLRLGQRRKLWLTASGTNPTLLDGRVLPCDQATEVKPKQKIKIYGFVMRCLFRKAKPRAYKKAAENGTNSHALG